jgi:hypothetical protein
MKNLFVLMALAGLAAFQVGCGGDEAKAPAKPPMTNPGVGMPGMPATGDDKKADGDKPAADADGDKAAEGDAAPADEAKDKEEAPKE